MEENVEIKKDNNLENLIGILLIMPIYILIFVILNSLRVPISIPLLVPLLMYLPIIIGMVLSYKNYSKKISKPIGICIFVFLVIVFYALCQIYFEESAVRGIEYLFFLLINTAILKIFLYIFYGEIVGWKKTIIFFIIYVLSVVSSLALGFLA